MPVLDGDEQHVSRLQDTFHIRSRGKLREAFSVWILHLHLHGKVQNWKLIYFLSFCVNCQSHLTGIVEQLWLMRVKLVCVLGGIQPNVFASHHLCTKAESHVVNKLWSQNKVLWQICTAVLLISPEPGSSAEDPGEEETLCLQVQTTRLQWCHPLLLHQDNNNPGGGYLPLALVSYGNNNK